METQMNFLKETIEAIEKSEHTIDQIIFIGSRESGHSCTWDEFVKLADFKYDDGFGGQEIARDLIIVFSDSTYMWRGEYDGSEWWDFLPSFVMPKTHKEIKRLKCPECLWMTLEEIQEDPG
jgi:hypothetical protein